MYFKGGSDLYFVENGKERKTNNLSRGHQHLPVDVGHSEMFPCKRIESLQKRMGKIWDKRETRLSSVCYVKFRSSCFILQTTRSVFRKKCYHQFCFSDGCCWMALRERKDLKELSNKENN